MKESGKIKGRREFLMDGIRTVVLGGFAFVGISLGHRGISSSGQKSLCAIDLPCRICSKLPGCEEYEAMDTKREYRDSLKRPLSK